MRYEKIVDDGMGVEIEILNDENFLLIKETLTRIGVANFKRKQLFQSCHIYAQDNKYYIVHFKELFVAEGRNNNIDFNDICRRNRIVNILTEWNLCKAVNVNDITDMVHQSAIRVIKHNEKKNWKLIRKFNL